MSSVNLPLSVIVGLLRPPGSVLSVYDYQNHIAALLSGLDEPGAGNKAPVGRPLKAQHPCYSDAELKAIRKYLQVEIKQNPEGWNNGAQGKPHGLLAQQPDDETRFYLDNGLTAVFGERVPVVDGVAQPSFPPGVSNE